VLAVAGLAAYELIGPLRYYLLSPFFLFYGYSLFSSDFRSLGDGLRSRQHLRNQLEIATNNPRDADAQYQIGLIYQKRRQYSEAIPRFERAAAIDPNDADPPLQLGRIALEQGRIDDAIRYLETSVRLDEKTSSSEGLRDLGAAYLGAGRVQEASSLLSRYTNRRPYDPEGLFHLGKALTAQGQTAAARSSFTECLEAVKTAPGHRRAALRKWGSEAQSALRNLK
jgi:tetratricopeptide (TPR) repeat protein